MWEPFESEGALLPSSTMALIAAPSAAGFSCTEVVVEGGCSLWSVKEEVLGFFEGGGVTGDDIEAVYICLPGASAAIFVSTNQGDPLVPTKGTPLYQPRGPPCTNQGDPLVPTKVTPLYQSRGPPCTNPNPKSNRPNATVCDMLTPPLRRPTNPPPLPSPRPFFLVTSWTMEPSG